MHGLRAIAYARQRHGTSLAELMEFIRFPSVSAQPRHAQDVRRCAAWLAAHMKKIGIADSRIVSTAGHPIVFGSVSGVPGAPTLLIYGHYDVQPVDPLARWRTAPFTPTVRGDDLFGRGACDDKGQLFIHLKAIEALLRAEGRPPVNIKCLFEGEEEIGSPNLPAFVERNREALASDVALMSDTPMLGNNRPAISCAERGALYVELFVEGPHRDLHSGNFGGAVHNPIQALCEILAQLHDAKGRIAIPGFYDQVRAWSEGERSRLALIGPLDADILREAGTPDAWGEPGYSAYERLTLRPALTLNGIKGGYQGPGGKGIIPSTASAKLSFRLVPDQDPVEVERVLRKHMARIVPPSVRARLECRSGAKAALVDPAHPAMQAAADAYARAFGSKPVFIRSGGTIPILHTFQRILDVPTVLMGFALPDDRIHAPNEKFHLPNFYRGIDTSIWFMRNLSNMRSLRGGRTGKRAVDRIGV